MGLFKSKDERRIEREMKIRQGIRGIERSIRQQEKFADDFIKNAQHARKIGDDNQYLFVRGALKNRRGHAVSSLGYDFAGAASPTGVVWAGSISSRAENPRKKACRMNRCSARGDGFVPCSDTHTWWWPWIAGRGSLDHLQMIK